MRAWIRRSCEAREWLRQSDHRQFAAVVIGEDILSCIGTQQECRDGQRPNRLLLEAICATVFAIASEESQKGHTPRKMTFDDRVFEFIAWAQPLSDPRKARITVKQLLNHTSGICPEATGAPIDGTWEFILGHTDDARTASLAFDPGTGCGYSSHALDHAALVCENVTGKPYDQYAIEALFKPLGIEHGWIQYYDGGPKYGRHPSDVQGPEMRFRLNAQTFSHGWELPARLTGEGGRSGRGIAADVRSKPGSGGQLIAFVPSLDLLVTRQTGSSGEWPIEKFLRRTCEAVVDAP